MRMALRTLLVCWLTTVLVLGGCAPRPAKKFRIVLIPKGTTHQFWQAIRAGALKAAAEHGDVEIVWQGPAKEDMRQEQQNIVERYTSEDVDALILAPVDRGSLVAPVTAALKKGIPVVVIDSGLDEVAAITDNPKYLGYVATDNYAGGKKAAERMAELFKGKKAKILMIPYQAGSESTEQREKGFLEHLRKAGFEPIIAKKEAGPTVDSAQKTAEGLLADHADLDAIFAPNESSTTGVLEALKSRKLTGQVKLVGFDSSAVLLGALKNGDIDGLVLQDPFQMGYEATRRALAALEGRAVERGVLHTNLTLATRDNVDTQALRAMHSPDLKSYLPK